MKGALFTMFLLLLALPHETRAARDCLRLSLTKAPQHLQIIPDVIPRTGPPVAIGLLAETPAGQQVLALGQQLGPGHAGLLKELRNHTGQDVRKVLWAGEVLLKREESIFKISAANETAGLLVKDPGALGIPFQIHTADAGVERLTAFLDKEAYQKLRSAEFQAMRFDPGDLHFDPEAIHYSGFRHESGNLGIRIKGGSRQILRTETPLKRHQQLDRLASLAERTLYFFKKIQAQQTVASAPDWLVQLLERASSRHVLDASEYDALAAGVDRFFRTHQDPIQVIE